MSYNWIDAATPQGRERLKELLDHRKPVIGKIHGQIAEFFIGTHLGLVATEHYDIGGEYHYGKLDEALLHGIEFLDPEQPNEIAALKAENERMRNALLDIEADARAKLAANMSLNSNETLHSVKHGLGQIK